MTQTTFSFISILVGALRLAQASDLNDEQIEICQKTAQNIFDAPDEVAEQAAYDEAVVKFGKLAEK